MFVCALVPRGPRNPFYAAGWRGHAPAFTSFLFRAPKYIMIYSLISLRCAPRIFFWVQTLGDPGSYIWVLEPGPQGSVIFERGLTFIFHSLKNFQTLCL
jgi:hypothetical protein